MADLSCFATKKNADEGKWFPVKIDGTKVPMSICLYGSDSDVVQNYEKNRLREVGKLASKNKNVDDEAFDELFDSQDEGTIIRIIAVSSYDWEKGKNVDDPLMLNGSEIKNDRKSFAFLIENFPAIKDFITEKSNVRSNFLDQRKKDQKKQ